MENKSKTVLIVDDIPYVRKTLKQILSQRGFIVAGEAEDGEEAVRLYAETLPDLVTMDLVMPILNGVEATRTILKKFPEAKIVVLSAMMQENLVADAILAGAKDYIIKPFQTDEVLRVLNDVAGSTSRKPAEEGGAA
ncbi:response regulator [bacterium]|nr:response regulator [bacterium]